MASLTGALNAPALYRYDAENLLACTGTSSAPLWRYWLDDVVVCVADDHREQSWTYHGGQQVATLRSGAGPSSTLVGADRPGSVLVEADTEVRNQRYTPYGYLPPGSAEPRIAYNGELLDNPSGCYLLGAGHHRPYSPALHCFLASDAFSPFEEGGLNAYAYCVGDPINRTDPSGHFWRWIVAGIAMVAAVATAGVLAAPLIMGSATLTASSLIGATISTVGAAAEVGSLIAEVAGDRTASGILGAVGLSTSLVGIGTALPSIAKAATGAIRKTVKVLGKGARSRTLSASSNPSGGWHTGGYLKLGDGSPPSPRPAFEGIAGEFMAPGKPAKVHPAPGPRLFKDLESEAKPVLEQVRQGLPTRYPKHDGTDYGNYSGYLPHAKRGHYKEYTVPTPGVPDRGGRRLVLGGLTPTGPENVYYSGDHYVTFKRVIFPDTMVPWYPFPR